MVVGSQLPNNRVRCWWSRRVDENTMSVDMPNDILKPATEK